MVGIATGLFGTLSNTLLVVAVLCTAVGLIARLQSLRLGRTLSTGGWLLFGGFWLALTYEYLTVASLPGMVLGIAAAAFTGFVVHQTVTQRTHPWTLTYAFVVSGVLYVPFTLFDGPRQWLIELVTQQTVWGLQHLGFTPQVGTGRFYGYQSAISFTHPSPTNESQIVTYIKIGCTGIGSIAVLSGVLAAADGDWTQRVGLAVVVSAVIYGLNFLRNVFIAAAFGGQWFQIAVEPVLWLSGYPQEDAPIVSFLIADKVIAQLLSAVVLLGLVIALFRWLPGVSSLVADIRVVLPTAVTDRLDAYLETREDL